MTLEKIRSFYGTDAYASTQTGIEILHGGKQEAVCRLVLEQRHTNGYGFVMGGVPFTLADFTFAIASNTEQEETVTLSSSIQYHSSAKVGECLLSKADCIHDGGRTCAYQVEIIEEKSQRKVASVSFTGYKTGRPGATSERMNRKESY